MQIIDFKEHTHIPKTKSTSTVPRNYTVEFIIEPTEKNIRNYETAKLLAEHINIIAESRKTISKGEAITWEEFQQQNVTQRKK